MLQGMGAKLGFYTQPVHVYIWLQLMGAKLAPAHGPYRLVVRLSRPQRDIPGLTPGEDMHYTD